MQPNPWNDGSYSTPQSEQQFSQAQQYLAGNPQAICISDTVYLSEASAEHYSSVIWATTGTADGKFDDASKLNAKYAKQMIEEF